MKVQQYSLHCIIHILILTLRLWAPAVCLRLLSRAQKSQYKWDFLISPLRHGSPLFCCPSLYWKMLPYTWGERMIFHLYLKSVRCPTCKRKASTCADVHWLTVSVSGHAKSTLFVSATAQVRCTVIPSAAVNLHRHQQVRGASLKLQKEQD